MKSLIKFVLFFMVIALVVLFVSLIINATDHFSFKTIDKLTILDDDSIVFIPEGSFILGDAYETVEIGGQMINQSKIPENKKIGKETLIKVDYKCVVYFDNEQNEALKLLGN
ncbi:MAG: hypothetical protein PHE32_02075 [Candidatus Shapirobacteria bacterium]|nr:hypothetical protein [Candidatus Shapirobacteria bacterium]MDD4410457.1 hypothetical protein [Candidatus Shapirobacteria bacterium]